MIATAFWHGLRASEVVSLTRDNLESDHLTIQRLKGSLKTRQLVAEHSDPLLNLRRPLFDYAQKLAANQKLFPISRQHFWRLMQKYGKEAGIARAKLHPHVLKHSIAMQTIKLAGIENVRQHLGHKSISSTGAYLKVTDEDASHAIQKALIV